MAPAVVPAVGGSAVRGRLEIPDDVPYSFRSDDHKLRWRVDAEVDIDNDADWVGTEPILMEPADEQTC
ncbi:MAG: hypothetical protein ABEN55_04930 [Bradymonadaceae bacterium]